MYQDKIRDSNLECLRLVAAFLIVAYHMAIFRTDLSGSIILQKEFSFNQLFAFITQSWGVVGVGCFFILSIWFLSEKKWLQLEIF